VLFAALAGLVVVGGQIACQATGHRNLWGSCASLPGEEYHDWSHKRLWACSHKEEVMIGQAKDARWSRCQGVNPRLSKKAHAESASTMDGQLLRFLTGSAPGNLASSPSLSTSDPSSVCLDDQTPMQIDCPEGLQPVYLGSNSMVSNVSDLDGGTVMTQDGVKFRLLGCVCKALAGGDMKKQGMCNSVKGEEGQTLKYVFSGHVVACGTDANNEAQRMVIATRLMKFQKDWTLKMKTMATSDQYPNDIVGTVDSSLRQAVAMARARICVGALAKPSGGNAAKTRRAISLGNALFGRRRRRAQLRRRRAQRRRRRAQRRRWSVKRSIKKAAAATNAAIVNRWRPGLGHVQLRLRKRNANQFYDQASTQKKTSKHSTRSYKDAFDEVGEVVIQEWIKLMKAEGLTVEYPRNDLKISSLKKRKVPQQSGPAKDYVQLDFTVFDKQRKLCTDSMPDGKGPAHYYLVRVEKNCNAENFMRSSVVMSGVENKGAVENTADFKLSACPPGG